MRADRLLGRLVRSDAPRRLADGGFRVLVEEERNRSRSGGKVGIPPGLRDFQGTVGTVGNRFVVFHGFHGPAFSTALRELFRAGRARLAGGRVAAHHVRPIADRHVPIQMLMDGHRAARQRTAKPALLQLPVALGNGDGVVLGHHALGLHGEDPVQVRARWCAGMPFLSPPPPP